MKHETCPRCGRKFDKFIDYPLVTLEKASFITPDQVPVPTVSEFTEENIDTSVVPADVLERAAGLKEEEKMEWLAKDGFVYSAHRWSGRDVVSWEKIPDISGKIKEIIEMDDVKEYRERIGSLVGKTFPPSELYPNMMDDGYFKFAYIPKKFIGLDWREVTFYLVFGNVDGENKVEVDLFKTGPNFGSAGGPHIIKVITLGTMEIEGTIDIETGDS
jgi:hypothetical protein